MKYILAIAFVATVIHCKAQLPHWKSLPIRFKYHDEIRMSVDSSEQVMYLFGQFDSVNGVQSNLVKWDGQDITYFNVPEQNFIAGNVCRYNGQLCISGGGAGISCFDGNKWYKITPPNRGVSTMYVLGDKLVAPGGIYDHNPNNLVNTIGIWDGIKWSDEYRVDTFFAGYLGGMTHMTEYKGELYFAGNIKVPSKPLCYNIVRFDGQHWKEVGGGIYSALGAVWDMLVWKNELYVCGQFTEQEGAPGNCVARWDGQRWNRLGGGFLNNGYDATINKMAVYKDKLYVTGTFSSVDGIQTGGSSIARWDGQKWCTLGSVFDLGPYNIESFGGSLFVSTGFKSIDGDTSYHYFAQWTGGDYTEVCSEPLLINREPTLNSGELLYPNPTSDRIFIRTSDTKYIFVYDVIGRTLLSTNYDPNSGIDISNLTPGVYTLRMVGREIRTVKFVKSGQP